MRAERIHSGWLRVAFEGGSLASVIAAQFLLGAIVTIVLFLVTLFGSIETAARLLPGVAVVVIGVAYYFSHTTARRTGARAPFQPAGPALPAFLAPLRLMVPAYRFLLQRRVGYLQFRKLNQHSLDQAALYSDIALLLPKANPPTQLSRPYVDAERKSRFVLLSTFTLAVALNNLVRSPRPFTSGVRKILFKCLGVRLGSGCTDLVKFWRRFCYRRRREFTDIALIGRIVGMGRLAAAEVPQFEYRVPASPEAFSPLLGLWKELSQPRAMLSVDQVNAISRDAWLMLGQMAWFRGVTLSDTVVPSDRNYLTRFIGLPDMIDDADQRLEFTAHFSAPSLPSGSFEEFLVTKVDEYRAIVGFRGSRFPRPVHSDANPEGQLRVDRFTFGLFQGLELAAIELRRAPALIAPSFRNLWEVKLWQHYSDFIDQADEFLRSKGGDADNVSLKYGTFLKSVFRASGRREVQGLWWVVFHRELPRWKLAVDPRSAILSAEMANIVKRGSRSSPAPAKDDFLFNACMRRCEAAGCEGNWDVAQLLHGTGAEVQNLVSRLMTIVCNHRVPTKYDRIVGVAHGGVIPAAICALLFRKTLSLIYSDNVINVIPQAAIAERWLLVDDAYQTGYSYQLIRSQMIGMKAMPAPEDSFVMFKARRRFDDQETTMFNLSADMEHVRSNIGYAVEYDYDFDQGLSSNSLRRYPVVVSDGTGTVDESQVELFTQLLRRRIAGIESSLAADGISTLESRVRQLTMKGDFQKLEMLFDHPDLILSIGILIHRVFQDEGILAYVAGSPKAIPFLVAANLYAAYLKPGSERIPLIVTHFNGELRYDRMLLQAKAETPCRALGYFDISIRRGTTLRAVNQLIQESLVAQDSSLHWARKKLVLSARNLDCLALRDGVQALFSKSA